MAHFEILIEDSSGKRLLQEIVPRILGERHTFQVIGYGGVGRLPPNIGKEPDVKGRVLLNKLPRLVKGYGKSLLPDQVLVVVVDSDRHDCRVFKKEILAVVEQCEPRPPTLIRLAVEEMEAWYLGDLAAVKLAYPALNRTKLKHYRQDSVCGTWETLAEAITPGGMSAIRESRGYSAGGIKIEWAERIGPHMDVEANESPSFRAFRNGLRRLAREYESQLE